MVVPRFIFDARRKWHFSHLYNTFENGEFSKLMAEKSPRLNYKRGLAWERFTLAYNQLTGDSCHKKQLMDLMARMQKTPGIFYTDERGIKLLRIDDEMNWEGSDLASDDPLSLESNPANSKSSLVKFTPTPSISKSSVPASTLWSSDSLSSSNPNPWSLSSKAPASDLGEAVRIKLEELDDLEFHRVQHLSLRFWIKSEDVCLILCEPSKDELIGLLETLSALCPQDAPANMATFILNTIQPTHKSATAGLSAELPAGGVVVDRGASPTMAEKGEDKDVVIEALQLLDDAGGESGSTSSGVSTGVNSSVVSHAARPARFLAKKRFSKCAAARCDINDRRPNGKRRYVMQQGYLSLPPSSYEYPEAQELLDRLAFRKKTVKKGDYSEVCPVCGRGGFTELTIRTHLKGEHQYILCKACRRLYPDQAAVQEHDCPLRSIPCDKCPKRFNSLHGWKYHKERIHDGTARRVCHVCGKDFASLHSLRIHQETRHGILPPRWGHNGTGQPGVVAPGGYPCPQCGKLLRSRVALRNHEYRMHGAKYRSRPCRYCSRVFSSRFSLKRHVSSVHRAQVDGDRDEGEEPERAQEEVDKSGDASEEVNMFN